MSGWIGFAVGVVLTSGVMGALMFLHDRDLKIRNKNQTKEITDKHLIEIKKILGGIHSQLTRTDLPTSSKDWLNNTACVRALKAYVLHLINKQREE